MPGFCEQGRGTLLKANAYYTSTFLLNFGVLISTKAAVTALTYDL
jgi:hypothetical protein